MGNGGGNGGAAGVANDPTSNQGGWVSGEGELTGDATANAVTGNAANISGNPGTAPASGEGEQTGNESTNTGFSAGSAQGNEGQGPSNSVSNETLLAIEANKDVPLTSTIVKTLGKALSTVLPVLGLPLQAVNFMANEAYANGQLPGNVGDVNGPTGEAGPGADPRINNMGFDAPKPPRLTPGDEDTIIPPNDDEEITPGGIRDEARRRRGRWSTILTGPQGLLYRPNVKRSTLLGF